MQISNKNWKLTTSEKSVAVRSRLGRDGGSSAHKSLANFNEFIGAQESVALLFDIYDCWLALKKG